MRNAPRQSHARFPSPGRCHLSGTSIGPMPVVPSRLSRQPPKRSTTHHARCHEHHLRPRGLPRPARKRGGVAPVREPRHHRASDHGRAAGPAGHPVRDGAAGGAGGGDGGRLLARFRRSQRLQRPRRTRTRQRHGLALQREVDGLSDHRHRGAAGAGPRAHRADALRPAGADRAAAREMGGGGHPAPGPAAHRAPRRQGRDDPADRAGVHLATRGHPQRTGRAGAGQPHPGRHRGPAERRGARSPRGPAAGGAAPGHRGRPRDRDGRCAEPKPRRLPSCWARRCTSRRCATAPTSSPSIRPSWARSRATSATSAKRSRRTT